MLHGFPSYQLPVNRKNGMPYTLNRQNKHSRGGNLEIPTCAFDMSSSVNPVAYTYLVSLGISLGTDTWPVMPLATWVVLFFQNIYLFLR